MSKVAKQAGLKTFKRVTDGRTGGLLELRSQLKKLYFAFDSVIKILKSYRPKKQLELRSHYKKKNDFHPLQIWTYDHMMCILITHYLAKINEHQNIVILKVDIKT